MTRNDKKQAASLDRIAAALEERTGRDTSREPRRERLPLIARFILFAGTSAGSSRRATALRRSYPIRGYVGPNGGGKSLAMVKDVLPSLAAGRPVLSTVKLLGPDGNPHPSYIPFTDFDQLIEFEGGDVLMDEIVGIANSRDSSSLPVQVQNKLAQLRRADVTMGWSAPNWARADKIIREVTQAVTECRGYYPGRPAADASGSGVRVWAPKRVFKFRTFDTIEFEEWSAGKREKLKPLNREWFKGPGSAAFAAYDTLDAVSMVGSHSDTCPYCARKKRAEYCKGHTDDEIARLREAQLSLGAQLVAVGIEDRPPSVRDAEFPADEFDQLLAGDYQSWGPGVAPPRGLSRFGNSSGVTAR